MVLIILASLILAEWSSSRYIDENFYLLPTRAWQLLGGALLAKLEIDKIPITHTALQKSMPIFGLCCVVYSILFFNDQMQHPSFHTAIPIVGVMLIIYFSSKDNVVTKLLSCRLFVLIGLISYSLYLWHVPVFAFARILSVSEPTNLDKIIWILLSIVGASLTCRFIEKFTRNRSICSIRKIWTIAFDRNTVTLNIFNLWQLYRRCIIQIARAVF